MDHLTALFDGNDADLNLGMNGMPVAVEDIGCPGLISSMPVPDRTLPVFSKLPPPPIIDLTGHSDCEAPNPMSQKPKMRIIPPSRRITRSMSKLLQRHSTHEAFPVPVTVANEKSAPPTTVTLPPPMSDIPHGITAALPIAAGPSRISGPIALAVHFLESELNRSQTQRRQLLAREAQILHILDQLQGDGDNDTSDPSEPSAW